MKDKALTKVKNLGLEAEGWGLEARGWRFSKILPVPIP